VNAPIIAALRAHAAGLHPEEADTELLIGHAGILPRDDFARFVHTGTSISDGTTLMAWIDWDAALTALHDGQIPVCSGEQRILQFAASIADGTLISLRQAIPGLDNRNLKLLITAIRHAAGQHTPAASRPPSRQARPVTRPGLLTFTKIRDTPHSQRRSPQGNCRAP
jgi:hypothetical protein